MQYKKIGFSMLGEQIEIQEDLTLEKTSSAQITETLTLNTFVLKSANLVVGRLAQHLDIHIEEWYGEAAKGAEFKITDCFGEVTKSTTV